MNLIELLYNVLLNFFYDSEAVLEPYQEQIIYLVTWFILIFLVFTLFKFIMKCIFLFYKN